LHPEASVRDVVVAIRADEALHRDANHLFSDVFSSKQVNLRDQIKEQADKQASAEEALKEVAKQ
jgi:hypothetical protein